MHVARVRIYVWNVNYSIDYSTNSEGGQGQSFRLMGRLYILRTYKFGSRNGFRYNRASSS